VCSSPIPSGHSLGISSEYQASTVMASMHLIGLEDNDFLVCLILIQKLITDAQHWLNVKVQQAVL
jgi:hypothetical protein